MKNKFEMSKEDNIFFAQRKLVDNIYKSANLEIKRLELQALLGDLNYPMSVIMNRT